MNTVKKDRPLSTILNLQSIVNLIAQIDKSKFQPNFVITWLAIFLINYTRAIEIFRFPSFWAEDGTFFFKDAIELGLASTYTPVVGHYHTIPRILAYIATFLPVVQFPIFIILTSGLVSSACFAYFVKDGFSWIIKSNWLRFIIAILISWLPGSEEVLFAYCDMNYIFYIFITLFFLEDYQGTGRMRLFREALFSTIWFSSGQGIVFLPVIFYELFKKNWLKLISFTSLLASIFLNWRASQNLGHELYNAAPFNFTQLRDLILVYFDNVFMRNIIRPLLNTPLTQSFAKQNDYLFYSIATLLLFFALRSIFKSKQFANHLFFRNKFLILMASTPLIFPLIYLVRGYSTHQLFKHELYFIGRYAVQPFLITVLLVIFVFKSIQIKQRWQKNIYFLFSLLIFINIFHYDLRFASDRISEFENTWPNQAAKIETAIEKVRLQKSSPEEIINDPIRCRPYWWLDKISKLVIKPL